MQRLPSAVLAVTLITASLYAQSSDTLTIENEFLKVIVNNQSQDLGRFAVETTQGDPINEKDDFQSLIYGRPIPWTSYTTFRINGTDYLFGGPSKKLSRRMGRSLPTGTLISQTKTDATISSEFLIGDIRVNQTLGFFRTPTTRVRDSVLVEYQIRNTGKVATSVGTRIMLDTKLGTNDGAPFRIGSRAITNEISIPKGDILPYWQTFDSIVAPTVIAQGSVDIPEDGVAAPDRMVLANWGSLADQPWDYDYVEGRGFVRAGEEENDTALAMYWNPVTLNPGQTIRIRTVYGLGGLTLAPGDLSLALSAPVEATIGSRRELLIMGYITNTGGFNAHNTVATFTLPNGMIPVTGNTTVQLGLLKVGESRQIPLRVIARRGDAGTGLIRLNVSSTTLAPNEIRRQIVLRSPGIADTEVAVPNRVEIGKERYVTASVKVTNPTNLPLENIIITVQAQDGISWFDVPTKSISVLLPGQSSTLDWTIGPLSSDTRASLDVKTSVSTFGQTPQVFQNPIQVDPMPSRLVGTLSDTKLKVGSYGLLTIRATNRNTPVNGIVSFNGSQIKALRLTPDIWVSQPLKIENNQVIIPTLSVPSQNSGSIVRFQFKTLKPGQSPITIQSGDRVDTLLLTIEN